MFSFTFKQKLHSPQEVPQKVPNTIVVWGGGNTSRAETQWSEARTQARTHIWIVWSESPVPSSLSPWLTWTWHWAVSTCSVQSVCLCPCLCLCYKF